MYAPPPKSIMICGIRDYPCVTYAVSLHPPTETYGDGPGEGVTEYAAKTIAIASSSDHFKNVQALEHEVYHAALWERDFKEMETWDLHAWICFSEGPFTMVLHDNPEFLRLHPGRTLAHKLGLDQGDLLGELQVDQHDQAPVHLEEQGGFLSRDRLVEDGHILEAQLPNRGVNVELLLG